MRPSRLKGCMARGAKHRRFVNAGRRDLEASTRGLRPCAGRMARNVTARRSPHEQLVWANSRCGRQGRHRFALCSAPGEKGHALAVPSCGNKRMQRSWAGRGGCQVTRALRPNLVLKGGTVFRSLTTPPELASARQSHISGTTRLGRRWVRLAWSSLEDADDKCAPPSASTI